MKSLFQIILFLIFIFLAVGVDCLQRESILTFYHQQKYLQTGIGTTQFECFSSKKKSYECLNYHRFLCQARDQSQSWSRSITRGKRKQEQLFKENLRNKTEKKPATGSTLEEQKKPESFANKIRQNMSSIQTFKCHIMILFNLISFFFSTTLRKSIITITRRYYFLIRMAYIFSILLFSNAYVQFLNKIQDQPKKIQVVKEDVLITLHRIRQQMSWAMHKLQFEYQNEMELIDGLEKGADEGQPESIQYIII